MFTAPDNKLFLIGGKCLKSEKVQDSIYMIHVLSGEIEKLPKLVGGAKAGHSVHFTS